MPITEDRIAKLREFGLSEYAARAYLALLDLGLTEARDISTLSKVPTSKIYHILEQLHERGLCIILPEFPKKYAPVPFSDYLDKLQTQHEEAARAIDRDRDRLTDMFAVAGDVDVGDRGTFTVLRGRRNVLSKIGELVREASREVFVMATRGSVERIEYTEEETRDAAERGVRTRFLVPLSADAIEKLEGMAEFAEIRERIIGEDDQGANVSISIYDNERALIVNFLPDDGHMYQGKDTAFFTDHEAMVAALRSVVEPHWAQAPSLEVRRRELQEGREREFTRVCASEEEAFERLAEKIRDGASEVIALRGAGMPEVPTGAKPVIEAILETRVPTRTAVRADGLEVAQRLVAMTRNAPNWDVRHVEDAVASRYWIVDDREAFVSIAHAGGAGDIEGSELMIHTSNPKTIRSLRAHFERVWAASEPMGRRVEALENGGSGGARPTTRFLPVLEESEAASREVVEHAEEALRVIARAETLADFAVAKSVAACAERDVRMRVLTTVEAGNVDAVRATAAVAEVRHVPRLNLLGRSADGKEAFIVLPRPPEGAGREGSASSWADATSVVVHSVDQVYVRAFDGFFEAQWDAAVPLEERLKELGEDPGPEASRHVPVK